jgi:probable rRNA maturation factor
MMKNSGNHSIKFHFLVKPFSFTKRNELKLSITKLFKLEKKKINSLSYIFCPDAFLLEINNKFLHHNYFTDILTFDLSEDKNFVIGDIYISVDRVRDNAQHLNLSFNQELRRVIFHGALHLCGYKDKEKKDIVFIRKKEDYYLQLFSK